MLAHGKTGGTEMRKTLPCIIMAAWISVLAIKGITLVTQKDFHYQLLLPSGWTWEASQGIKEKPVLLNSIFKATERNSELLQLPLGIYSQLKEKVFGDSVLHFYRKDSPGYTISVYEKMGRMNLTKSEVRGLCEFLRGELSRLHIKSVMIRECDAVTFGPTPALRVVFDAFETNQEYVQYIVQKGPNSILVFAVSPGQGRKSDIIATEFSEIMKTFEVTEDQSSID
jgi:hypothetical protein